MFDSLNRKKTIIKADQIHCYPCLRTFNFTVIFGWDDFGILKWRVKCTCILATVIWKQKLNEFSVSLISAFKMLHFFSISVVHLIVITLITSDGRADDSHIVLYNEINNCKSNEYFDPNYFLCRLCDPQLHLVPSENGRRTARRLIDFIIFIIEHNL